MLIFVLTVFQFNRSTEPIQQPEGAPLHPPAWPFGCHSIICEYCHLTYVLLLPALFNCWLMKNKVNTVQCTGTRKRVLLSPNFAEKEPAVLIRDSLGSAPREPSWPGIATPVILSPLCVRNLKSWPAHTNHVFACDWHPELRKAKQTVDIPLSLLVKKSYIYISEFKILKKFILCWLMKGTSWPPLAGTRPSRCGTRPGVGRYMAWNTPFTP